MTAAEPTRLPAPPSHAAQVAADVAILLRKGRVTVALAQLEKLPAAIVAELVDRVGAACWCAYRDGYERGQQELVARIQGAAKPKKPGRPRDHEWLARRIADPALRAKARAALRLSDAMLNRAATGTVQLSPDQWRLLRQVLSK